MGDSPSISVTSFLKSWHTNGLPGCSSTTLPRPAPRSMRPHEIMPGLYLGDRASVVPRHALVQRLYATSVARLQATSLSSTEDSAAPSTVATPHGLFLMVSACVEATHPRLELRAALAPCAPRKGLKECLLAQACDVLLEQHPLSGLTSLLSFAGVDDVIDAGNASKRLMSALQHRLHRCHNPGHDQHSAILPACEASSSSPSPSGGQCWFFWRLALPIADDERADIAKFFPLTNFLLRAVLTAPPMPSSVLCPHHPWTATANGTLPVSGDLTPCVVVHCMAGVSRSATLVAAFLLSEWGQWSHTGMASVPEAEGGADSIVQQVVDFLRCIRLCVRPNDGFCEQLRQFAHESARTTRCTPLAHISSR